MRVTTRQWKILDLLKTTESLFKEKAVPNPRLSTELLLAGTLCIERIQLYLDFEKPLTENELADFRAKVRRRLNNEPLQYILGEAHFYGRKFSVNPSVLIPRPETELLVERTLELIKEKNMASPKLLEIGAGSGCISISIACNIQCSIDAIDISAEAIGTAKKNLEMNKPAKADVNFFKLDFLKDNIDISRYDIVISNPPYIPADELPTLANEIKDHEPKYALTDLGDGLEFYRRIFGLYNSAEIKPYVLLEIGDGKRDAVEKLICEFGIKGYSFHKDLVDIERVIVVSN